MQELLGNDEYKSNITRLAQQISFDDSLDLAVTYISEGYEKFRENMSAPHRAG